MKHLVAGIDEAGRGALAGPVVAAAVIVPDDFDCTLLKDSKVLSPRIRSEVCALIMAHCMYGVGMVSAKDVDRLGIKKATHAAMKKALHTLPSVPQELWIDGNDGFVFSIPSSDFVRGDVLYPCISAASIIAKTVRDQYMYEIAESYPKFQFDSHKGYGTEFHRNLLEKGEYTPFHRKTYQPLKQVLTQGKLF